MRISPADLVKINGRFGLEPCVLCACHSKIATAAEQVSSSFTINSTLSFENGLSKHHIIHTGTLFSNTYLQSVLEHQRCQP